MKQNPPSLQEEIKEYILVFFQVTVLVTLLIIPSKIGQWAIIEFGFTEINYFMTEFTIIMGAVLLYYGTMLIFHQNLIDKIDANIYVKILMVSVILFWCIFDGTMVYTFQEVYSNNQERIIRRDIVWSDVDFFDLPADVVYPNFRAGFLGLLSAMRFFLVAVLAYKLIVGDKTPEEVQKPVLKKKRKEKSIDDIKATLHPSILKQYQNKENQD